MSLKESMNISSEIESFCKDYLVDLTDIGYQIHIEFIYNGYYRFHLRAVGNDITWDDMKDIFIPFLQMFMTEYRIYGNIRFNFDNGEYSLYNVDLLINDTCDNRIINNNIDRIMFDILDVTSGFS
jgi:hypothetical protein